MEMHDNSNNSIPSSLLTAVAIAGSVRLSLSQNVCCDVSTSTYNSIPDQMPFPLSEMPGRVGQCFSLSPLLVSSFSCLPASLHASCCVPPFPVPLVHSISQQLFSDHPASYFPLDFLISQVQFLFLAYQFSLFHPLCLALPYFLWNRALLFVSFQSIHKHSILGSCMLR